MRAGRRRAGPGGPARTRRSAPRGQAGLTLMEVLVAMSLLSLLAVGTLIALEVGTAASAKTNSRLIDNRRVAGAQRILEQEIAGFMPVNAMCGAGGEGPKPKMPFFQGEPQAMRFVSTYSLQEAWRGRPQILEFMVLPRDDGKGVRLVVNEHLYSGPMTAGQYCMGPGSQGGGPMFPPIQTGPMSFILADKLAYCRFSYLTPSQTQGPQWSENFGLPRYPVAVRVEMAPFQDDAARLRPVTITERIQVTRSPEIVYEDQ